MSLGTHPGWIRENGGRPLTVLSDKTSTRIPTEPCPDTRTGKPGLASGSGTGKVRLRRLGPGKVGAPETATTRDTDLSGTGELRNRPREVVTQDLQTVIPAEEPLRRGQGSDPVWGSFVTRDDTWRVTPTPITSVKNKSQEEGATGHHPWGGFTRETPYFPGPKPPTGYRVRPTTRRLGQKVRQFTAGRYPPRHSRATLPAVTRRDPLGTVEWGTGKDGRSRRSPWAGLGQVGTPPQGETGEGVEVDTVGRQVLEATHRRTGTGAPEEEGALGGNTTRGRSGDCPMSCLVSARRSESLDCVAALCRWSSSRRPPEPYWHLPGLPSLALVAGGLFGGAGGAGDVDRLARKSTPDDEPRGTSCLERATTELGGEEMDIVSLAFQGWSLPTHHC